MDSKNYTGHELASANERLRKFESAKRGMSSWQLMFDYALRHDLWSRYEITCFAAMPEFSDGYVFLQTPAGVVRLYNTMSFADGGYTGRLIVERAVKNQIEWKFTPIHWFPLTQSHFGYSETSPVEQPLGVYDHDYRLEQRLLNIGAIVTMALLDNMKDVAAL